MHTCEYCGREGFKSIQGLKGHVRMIHNGAASEEPRRGLGDPLGRTGGRQPENRFLLNDQPVQFESPARLIGDEIQLRFQEQQESLTILMQGVEKLLQEFGQIPDLINKVDRIINQMEISQNQHLPGLCKEKTCSANCRIHLTQIRVELLEIIEHRIPNTKEVLSQIDKAMRSGDFLDLPMESLHLADEVQAKNRSDPKAPPDTFTLGLVKSIWG